MKIYTIHGGGIEGKIRKSIYTALNSFLKNNPTLKISCDEITLQIWFEFIEYCYCMAGISGEIGFRKQHLSVCTPLMKHAAEEAIRSLKKFQDKTKEEDDKFKEIVGDIFMDRIKETNFVIKFSSLIF